MSRASCRGFGAANLATLHLSPSPQHLISKIFALFQSEPRGSAAKKAIEIRKTIREDL